MFRELHSMSAPDGSNYGFEWMLDPFDLHIDQLLRTKDRNAYAPGVKTAALDIGCGTGMRAETLTKHSIFDHVIASDVFDRSPQIDRKNKLRRLAKELVGNPAPTPIQFLQADILEMTPADFPHVEITYINCRNVIHFLAPDQIRKALANIRDIASDRALVTISFDHITRDAPPDKCLRIHDADSVDKFYSRPRISKTPYAKYARPEIVALLRSLGFKTSVSALKECRPKECRITAIAPAKPTTIKATGFTP